MLQVKNYFFSKAQLKPLSWLITVLLVLLGSSAIWGSALAERVPSAGANVLLHTTLEDLAAIESPAVGVGGTTTLNAEDFVAAQEGNGANFMGNGGHGKVVTFPAAHAGTQNVELDRGEVEFSYRPNYDAGADDVQHHMLVVGDIDNVPRLTLYEGDRLTLSLTDANWQYYVTHAGYRAPLWEANEWVHIRATWDKDASDPLRIYLNGVRVDEGGATGGWDLGAEQDIGSIFVGASDENGVFSAEGVMDELIIRNAPQTSTTPIPTATDTPNPSEATNTPTSTATNTATPTATSAPANTSTPTATPIAGTPTNTPQPGSGDAYESDDSCAQASAIAANGAIQHHTFHQEGDTDWVDFEATAGMTYLIEAQVPLDSLADISFVLYDQCGGGAQDSQNNTFSPTIRLEFTAVNDGTHYLELFNHDPSVAGSNVSYDLSVRTLANEPTVGALIVVAGRLRANDRLQSNIHFVTDAIYRLFQEQNYRDEDIYYIATDPNLTGFDAPATAANLEFAITSWARDKVAADRALTIYIMDHGDVNRLYLDRPRSEWVTPQQLDSWLSELEAVQPGLKTNVIIEACNSGSFIEGTETMSAPGRVIISSTGTDNLAWASNQGAIFSDHFISAMGQQSSLYMSFQAARAAVDATSRPQTPWLDGDGDGIPNEAEDQSEAALRGFAYAGTLSGEQWPPYIAQSSVSPVENERVTIQVEVLDDIQVDDVWAVIYPPSYQAPKARDELAFETLKTVTLLDQGNNAYGATYPGFNQNGTYRIVIYAEDQDGLQARPVTIEVQNGTQLYLPLVIR